MAFCQQPAATPMHLAQRHRPPGKGIGIVMAGQQHSTATEWLAAGGFGFGFGFGLGGIEGGLPPHQPR